MTQFFTTEISDFQGLKFITVKSNALKKRADLTVFIPFPKESEQVSKNALLPNLPIVILLHGVYGSHWAWTMKGKAHETLQNLVDKGKVKPMILALPSDGLFGDGSGYVPHKTENYERWIVEDVVEVVKEQIPQATDASPIFITGLSMGGFGAMRLGAKYPSVFSGFSGLSSITHFEQMAKFVQNFDNLKENALEKDGILDWILKNKEYLPPFRFDCGQSDILIEPNRQLHNDLVAHQIPHIYEEFDGAHSWDYWSQHIEKTLVFFDGLCRTSSLKI